MPSLQELILLYRTVFITLALLLTTTGAWARVVRITRDEVRCVTVTRDDGTSQTRCSVRRIADAPRTAVIPPALAPLPLPPLEPPCLDEQEIPPPLGAEQIPGPGGKEIPPPLRGEGDHKDPSPFPRRVPPEAPADTSPVIEGDEVLALLNVERQRRGLGRLTLDPLASAVARAHSRDMCHRRYFGHVSPDGKRPWDRLRAAGVRFRRSAENVAVGYRSPEEVHRGWLESPGHRRNRLNPAYTRAGVGSYSCDGTVYWTEVFMGD